MIISDSNSFPDNSKVLAKLFSNKLSPLLGKMRLFVNGHWLIKKMGYILLQLIKN